MSGIIANSGKVIPPIQSVRWPVTSTHSGCLPARYRPTFQMAEVADRPDVICRDLVSNQSYCQKLWIWRDRATKAIDGIKGESVSSG